MESDFNPFRLDFEPKWAARLVERVTALDTLAGYYDARPKSDEPDLDQFLDYTLQVLNARFELDNPAALQDIPREGPLVVVCNHPMGGLEGVAMTKILRDIRPDLKVLTNELLARIPEFENTFIGVDVLSENAAAKNSSGMRRIIKHVKAGNSLLIYPAGQVSAINTDNWRIEDRGWHHVVGTLTRLTKATVVPCHVHARNSGLFYFSGLIHPRLRTAMLPREMAKPGKAVARLKVGTPILYREIKELKDPHQLTAYFRTASDLLSDIRDSEHTLTYNHPPLNRDDQDQEHSQQLQKQVQTLNRYSLLKSKQFEVICAPYQALGPLMDEIAVAREHTFRLAGEGTGKQRDSDRFDPHYSHLFVWDHEFHAIVGAYRVGIADEIITQKGVDGLYSRSLYEFDTKFIERLGGAVEVGRSFVSVKYQRHPKALDLLWQGLGRWIATHPPYHTLFGCVSISREHSFRARAFLQESLMHSFRAEQEFLEQVRPVAPIKIRNRVWNKEVLQSLSNVTLINKLLGQCDPGKSIPVLLRQYLALNGRFIGFSVNHSFNDSLDGLIMVDMRKTPQKYLKRYMGDSGSAQFQKLWGLDSAIA